MPTDLQSFTLAFLIVWGGLAAYFARLHALARRLERGRP
jgi:hypothetical protein